MILNPRQGFDPEDIDIRVEGGKLIMVGEREIKRGNSFSKRMFNQKFDLPEGIDIDGISSEMARGGSKLLITAPQKKTQVRQNVKGSLDHSKGWRSQNIQIRGL